MADSPKVTDLSAATDEELIRTLQARYPLLLVTGLHPGTSEGLLIIGVGPSSLRLGMAEELRMFIALEIETAFLQNMARRVVPQIALGVGPIDPRRSS